jgi:DNA-binding response OmpR family regulator
VPVILVGPAADPVDRVRGFARGADDYVGTPIVYEELVARMRAVLRRATGGRARETIVVGGLEIDRPARVVRLGGRALELSAKEFELLAALAAEPDRVWTKDELLRGVWGFRSTGRTRTLESHASRLRRKLNADGDARWIVNVWGVGYKLV